MSFKHNWNDALRDSSFRAQTFLTVALILSMVLFIARFFEFIQARLCVVVSPTYEMAELVNEYQLGVVSSGFNSSDMADAIKNLTRENIMQYKQNSHLAAKTLTSKPNLEKIHSIVSTLAGK